MSCFADGIYNFYSTVDVHECEITTLSVSPNERYVLSGSKDQRIKVYDTWESETQSTLTGHSKMVNILLAFSFSILYTAYYG